MDHIDAVLQAENELLNALRSGELLKGVAMHLDSPDYRNIWNGELKTHAQLRSRIEAAIGAGLVSIDYQVSDRESYVLDGLNVLNTLTAIETTHMSNGQATSSPPDDYLNALEEARREVAPLLSSCFRSSRRSDKPLVEGSLSPPSSSFPSAHPTEDANSGRPDFPPHQCAA